MKMSVLLAVLALVSPSFAVIQPSGDTKGATDYTAITEAVAQGGTVELGEGTFYVNHQIELTGAVTLKGAGRDVTIVKQIGKREKNSVNHRAFYMNNASAVLSDLTVTGGFIYAGGSNIANNGAGVLIDTNGGQVLDCRVTDCVPAMNSYSAVYLNGDNALVARTIIDNNKVDNTYDNKYGFQGSGVYVSKGRVESCLITGNTNWSTGRNATESAVCAGGGCVVNCTITANDGVNAGGAYAGSGKFYNCIIYGNSASKKQNNGAAYAGSVEWDGKAENFINCMFVDPLFKDVGDYHLKSASEAIGAGNVTDISIGDSKDLDGVKLVRDGKSDLGCYQYVPDGTVTFDFEATSETTIFAGGQVSFRVVVDGAAPSDYSYAWSFGDELSSTEAEPTITFEKSGRYDVRLVVTDPSSGETLFDETRPSLVLISREVIELRDGESFALAVEEAMEGCKIVLAEGTFALSSNYTLPAGVSITGAGDGTLLNLNKKQLVINHPDSFLKDCKVTGCDIGMNTTGGGVVIGENGGTVSGCWFDGSKASLAYNSYGLCLTVKGASGLVTHCRFTNNDMRFKNNAYGSCIALLAGQVDNCLFADNQSINGGAAYLKGGMFRNCTVVGNKATRTSEAGLAATSWNGGGLYVDSNTGLTIQNCLVCNNTADTGGDNWYCTKTLTEEQKAEMFVNCCFEDLKIDETYHLLVGSPSINAGLDYDGVDEDTDLDGAPRKNGKLVDIGCYEYVASSEFICTIEASKPASFVGEYVSLKANLEDEVDPAKYDFAWDFGEAGVTADVQNPTVALSALGPHDVTLVITEKDGGTEMLRTTEAGLVKVYPRIVEIYPGDDIGAAFDDILDGQTITFAADGEYVFSNDVTVAHGVTITGQGVDKTIMRMAKGVNKRFFTLNHPDAVVTKLTLSGGGCDSSTDSVGSYHGGGVRIEAKGGCVSECRITGCQSGMNGMGMAVYLNSADAHVTRCVIDGNFSLNRFPSGAAVTVDKGQVDNCLIVSNSVSGTSRGDSRYAGGLTVNGGKALNCTVVGNKGHGAGGVGSAAAGRVINCIAADNTIAVACTSVASMPEWCGTASSFENCIVGTDQTAPNETCLSSDPKFVDAANMDFHLQKGSPAINAGTYAAWMDAATDLDGNPRVKHVKRYRATGEIKRTYVDLGCYETEWRGPGFAIWLK